MCRCTCNFGATEFGLYFRLHVVRQRVVLSCNVWVDGMCETWRMLWLSLCTILCFKRLGKAFNLLQNVSLP